MNKTDKNLSIGILISKIILTIIGLIIFVTFIYFCYNTTKDLSYSFFYEDMVQETIREMVKPGYLKNMIR